MTRPGERTPRDVPLQAAPWLVQLSAGGRPLRATSFAVMPDGSDIPFRLVYPRPAASTVQLHASYLDRIAYMRPGTVMVKTKQSRLVATALLTRDQPDATLSLELPSGASAGGAHGFAAYFKLGVEHILTGFDHLLFLAALLIGVRKTKPMLVIVTTFTLAHSITLGLAAFDVIVLPARIVEPLIAASIIVVGLENIFRREASADRYWLSGLFGLIHGFGFASLLRETALARSGGEMIVALLGFNLGVESGQMLVAAPLVPLLLLLRRKTAFDPQGVRALSTVVIAVSAVWLWQRLAA
jgi:hydrogenase/urease accessory protein HupE